MVRLWFTPGACYRVFHSTDVTPETLGGAPATTMPRAKQRPCLDPSVLCRFALCTGLASALLLALTGCPAPIPTCEKWDYAKPSVGATKLMPVDTKLEAGRALVFGRIEVRGTTRDGLLFVRLVRLDPVPFGNDQPYAEQTLRLDPDGRFQWLLPEADYVIQPVYYHYDYDRSSYKNKATMHLSFEFSAAHDSSPIYVGNTIIAVTADFDPRAVEINNELADELPRYAASRLIGGRPTIVSLMRHNEQMAALTVAYRDVCREENPICWGLFTPGGSMCFNADRPP